MNKYKILIVDDEEVNRAILNMMFEEEFEVLEATDGKYAIEKIEQNKDLPSPSPVLPQYSRALTLIFSLAA